MQRMHKISLLFLVVQTICCTSAKNLRQRRKIADSTVEESLVLKDYLIQIKTGDKLHADSGSDIYLTIFGDSGVTEELHLNPYIPGNTFQRGCLDNLTLVDLRDVGVTTNVTLRSESQEFEYCWYLDWISVDNATAFLNRWICGGESVSANFDVDTSISAPSAAPSIDPSYQRTVTKRNMESFMIGVYVFLAIMVVLFILCAFNVGRLREICGCLFCCIGCCLTTGGGGGATCCCPCLASSPMD